MVLDAPSPWISRSAAETGHLGRALGALLEPGDFVGLLGELGAGKTAFAAGLGQGLGVTVPLRSPSYLLCCEYEGRSRLLHLDAYFEARMAALLAEGLPDRFRESVVVVEWADHCAEAWPADRLEIRLSSRPEPEERQMEARGSGPRSRARLQAWQAGWPRAKSPSPLEPGPTEAR